MKYTIIPFHEKLKDQVVGVWEKSVLATHDFLHHEDFLSIKAIVSTIDFTSFEVYCLMEKNEVLGFLGVADKKVEMLFLSPDYFGLGLGKKLMDFALTELSADKVDVNEQNVHAVKFYQKLGFITYERTDKDDQGKDYPLLRMRLKSQD